MKQACIALIRDVALGPMHLEAHPSLFDSPESVAAWAQDRLNARVTVVVEVQKVEVADEVKLVKWSSA